MQPEELLQMLRDGGMDDAGIAQLLDAAKGMLDPVEPAPEAEPVEDDAAKADRIFGTI